MPLFGGVSCSVLGFVYSFPNLSFVVVFFDKKKVLKQRKVLIHYCVGNIKRENFFLPLPECLAGGHQVKWLRTDKRNPCLTQCRANVWNSLL